MILNKSFFFVFFFSLTVFLNSIELKTKSLANNIINIPQGNLFSSFSRIGLKDEAGLSFAFGTLNSTIEEFNFNSHIISSDFTFLLKNFTIKTDFDFLLGNNLIINNSISFDSFSLMIGNIKIAEIITPLSLSASFSTGKLLANGGKIYFINVVPNVSFLSVALESKSKIGNFFLQYGFFNININSESKTQIISSSFQNDFLFLYSNNISFANSNLSFWGGTLYTNGKATAYTTSEKLKAEANDYFFIIGTGTSFSYSKKLFYITTNLDFIFLPISKANASININIPLLFFQIKENLHYVLDETFNYGLLIPSIEVGIKFSKKGKIFLSKNFPIPVSFKQKSNINNTVQDSSQNFTFLNILLSGISIGFSL